MSLLQSLASRVNDMRVDDDDQTDDGREEVLTSKQKKRIADDAAAKENEDMIRAEAIRDDDNDEWNEDDGRKRKSYKGSKASSASARASARDSDTSERRQVVVPDQRFPKAKGRESNVRKEIISLIRSYVGDLRLLESGSTGIDGSNLKQKYTQLINGKSMKEIPTYMADLAELRGIYKIDATAIDMKETELAVLASDRAVDVPTMKTATDEMGSKYIDYCQSEIGVLAKKLKLMKQCSNLMQYYMNRKVDDLQAIDVLLHAFKERFMEGVGGSV